MEKENQRKRPVLIVLLIWSACFLLRAGEYFLLRTDQTILGEAFVHKLLGIGILFLIARRWNISNSRMGFTNKKFFLGFLKGLLFGVGVFAAAYISEICILIAQGNFAGINIYVSAYAVDGNIGNRTAAFFFVICILGNLINVFMEEGLFRGLFPAILEQKYKFIVSAILASVLFGLWHIMAPLRNYVDGTVSLGGFIGSSMMLIFTSALVGFKFAMLAKLTGSLYISMGDHFVNNTIVNMLHVLSNSGADELMPIRIAIAQSISFCIVLICYCVKARKNLNLEC